MKQDPKKDLFIYADGELYHLTQEQYKANPVKDLEKALPAREMLSRGLTLGWLTDQNGGDADNAPDDAAAALGFCYVVNLAGLTDQHLPPPPPPPSGDSKDSK